MGNACIGQITKNCAGALKLPNTMNAAVPDVRPAAVLVTEMVKLRCPSVPRRSHKAGEITSPIFGHLPPPNDDEP